MKLDVRFEGVKKQPIVFWLDCPDVESWEVMAWGQHCEHVTASRAYMRKCKKPETRDEIQQAAKTLALFGNLYSTS